MSERPIIEEVCKRPEYFDAVWSKSIEYYGVTKQSVVCMEECAELIEAIDDRRRDGLTDGTRVHLIEEMADVLNVSRTSLSRELGRLQDEKIIEFEGKKVKLLDLNAINEYSF